MFERLRQRNEWKFFGVMPKASRGLTIAWWTALLLRGLLPVGFAIATGFLIGAVQRGGSLSGPLALVGGLFVLLQVLAPVHHAISASLGDQTAGWLYDRLTEACARPPGIGHLEDAKLATDLTVALKGARVLEIGTHGELKARGGHYAALCDIQAAAYR